MYDDITELFCFIDDFCNVAKQQIKENLLQDNCVSKKSTRVPSLADSEIITILLLYTHSPKDFECVDPVLGLSCTPSTARRLCSEPPAGHSFNDWV
jgi:hypothetical protein